MTNNPVLTAGSIAGLIGAAYSVVVAQGMFEFLRPDAQTALHAFVALAVPIIAAAVAARFVTPTAAPNLPVGTVVNARTESEPTATVVADV